MSRKKRPLLHALCNGVCNGCGPRSLLPNRFGPCPYMLTQNHDETLLHMIWAAIVGVAKKPQDRLHDCLRRFQFPSTTVSNRSCRSGLYGQLEDMIDTYPPLSHERQGNRVPHYHEAKTKPLAPARRLRSSKNHAVRIYHPCGQLSRQAALQMSGLQE